MLYRILMRIAAMLLAIPLIGLVLAIAMSPVLRRARPFAERR
jgi:hypothetical protein